MKGAVFHSIIIIMGADTFAISIPATYLRVDFRGIL